MRQEVGHKVGAENSSEQRYTEEEGSGRHFVRGSGFVASIGSRMEKVGKRNQRFSFSQVCGTRQ
jgi:hypothetical protein